MSGGGGKGRKGSTTTTTTGVRGGGGDDDEGRVGVLSETVPVSVDCSLWVVGGSRKE